MFAHVFGTLRDHDLLGIEPETQKMLVLVTLNLVERIAQTVPKIKRRVR
jgi:hypothetical protein